MQKFISILITVLLLTVILAGCVKSNMPAANSEDSNKKINVVATTFAPYDFVREIAGDKANVTMLLPPGSESHSYEPTPQDIIRVQNCDVFIYVGGDSDEWVNKVLSSMDTSSMKIVTLMDCVALVDEEVVEGMEDENDVEADLGAPAQPEYDEHVWTSPKNAKLIVQRISDALCEADSINADIYRTNTTAYIAKLNELDAAFQKVVDEGVRKTIVFGDRFPFRYFADAYNLSYFAAFPGCATQTEPSAATVSFLINKVKAENIPVVFHIELSNEKMADTICEATGAKKLLLHACHNISKSDFQKGVSYLNLMTANVESLKEALN